MYGRQFALALTFAAALHGCSRGAPDDEAEQGTAAVAQGLSLTFTAGPSLPGPVSDGSALRSSTGTVFLVGGINGNPIADVATLPSGAGAWTKAPRIDQGRAGVGIGNLPGGTLLVFGGAAQNSTLLSSAVRYDPTLKNPTIPVASMATARSYPAYATDDAGKVYAIGGISPSGPTASVEVFDPTTQTWTALASLPEPLSRFAAAFDGRGHIFTFGGVNAANALISTVYRYTISSGTWDTLAATLPAPAGPSAAVLGPDDKIFVVSTEILAYHLVGDFWTQEGVVSQTAGGRVAAAIDGQGRLLLMGGIANNQASRTVTVVAPLAEPVGAPVFVSTPAPIALQADATLLYRAIAEGAPHATYSLVAAPPGMTIDPIGGLVSWTPTLSQIGPVSVTVRATNSAGTADQSFSGSVVGPTPPAPAQLSASNIDETSFDLSWSPVTSPAGPVTYGVYVRVSCGRGCITFTPTPATIVGTSATIGNRAPGQTDTFAVRAFAGGSVSDLSPLVTVTTLAPSAPAGLAAASVSQTAVTLVWEASSGPAPIEGYHLYEGGVLLQTLTGLTATVEGLQPGSFHLFAVRAFDAAGESASSSVLVTTFIGPTISHVNVYAAEQVVAVVGEPMMVIANTSPLTSSVAADYAVRATGTPAPIFSIVSGPAGMTVDSATGVVTWVPPADTPTGLTTATVRATNSTGSADLTFDVTAYPAGSDLLVPTIVPTFLTLTDVTQTSASFTWFPATDNVGVAGYNLYLQTPPTNCTRAVCSGGPIIPVAVALTTSYTLTGLSPGTSYAVWFEPFDAAGNVADTHMGQVLPLLRINTAP